MAKKKAPRRETKYDLVRRGVSKSTREKMLRNYERLRKGQRLLAYTAKDIEDIKKNADKHNVAVEELPPWIKNGLGLEPEKSPIEQALDMLNQLGEGAVGAAPPAIDQAIPELPTAPGGGSSEGGAPSLDIQGILSQLGLDKEVQGPTPEQTQAAVAQFFGGPIQPQVNAIGDQLRGTAGRLEAIAPGAGGSVANLAAALQNQPQGTAQFAASLQALQKMGNRDPYESAKLKLEGIKVALEAQSLARAGRAQEAQDIIDRYNAQTSRLGALNDRTKLSSGGESLLDRLYKVGQINKAFSSDLEGGGLG